MQTKQFVWISLTAMSLFACTAAALAAVSDPQGETESEASLVETVRRATERFHSVQEALDAGYTDQRVCVTGPEEGAMGVHFVNPELFGDGKLDPEHPDLLVYEPKNGQLRLVAVEYVIDAATWDDAHKDPPTPPALLGQLFHYSGSPNRYGIPPFYELHVWAWKHNPHGMFTDWNPRVSCADYAP